MFRRARLRVGHNPKNKNKNHLTEVLTRSQITAPTVADVPGHLLAAQQSLPRRSVQISPGTSEAVQYLRFECTQEHSQRRG